MPVKPLIVCLVGPTAVGKTEVALKLAKKLGAEIISCDSMQIYKGVDIASAKPTRAQRKKIPHHLIDVVKPSQEYNAARFRRETQKLIVRIHRKNRVPLIVAGTGLYLRALLDGMFVGPGQNREIRKNIAYLAQRYGRDYCYRKLSQIDPAAAQAIHPHDLRRIIRALEVYQITGRPITELQKSTRGIRNEYNVHIFGLKRQREELYRRIEQRVESMFNKGLVREIKRLSKNKISQTARSLLGYRQVLGFLRGEYSRHDAKKLLALDTRHYAKRQMSWFRHEKGIEWIDVGPKDTPVQIANKITILLTNQQTS